MIFFEFNFTSAPAPGYQFFDDDGEPVDIRTNADIVELIPGSNQFVVATSPPEGFSNGWVLVDNGATPTTVYFPAIRVSNLDIDEKFDALLNVGRRFVVSEEGDNSFFSIFADDGEESLPTSSNNFLNHGLVFREGPLKGIVVKIQAWTGATNPVVTITPAFPSAPELGMKGTILGKMA